jgi:hypothetical protein
VPILPTIPQCHHIKDNGVRCGSPALRGKDLCYFHLRQLRQRPTLHIPILEDRPSIQFAVTQVLRAALEDRIDDARLRTLLYALQVASMNLRNCERSSSNPEVRQPRSPQAAADRAPVDCRPTTDD